MRHRLVAFSVLLVATLLACKSTSTPGEFASDYGEDAGDFADRGRNPFFNLEPGYELRFAGKEDAKDVELVIRVTGDTRKFGPITTRVVEERETVGGALAEISRNYFAISKRTNNIYYFGEDVDIYKNGAVSGHGGSWHHGEGGARYGLAMPARAEVGARFMQENAPHAAMDRGEIVSVTEVLAVPAGRWTNCVKVRETTPLEPDNVEYKYYAPGVGLVRDGSCLLVSYGIAK
jgi:hypothetical protein